MANETPGMNDQQNDPKNFIIKMNEELTSSGAGKAELAFALGCGISIVPIGILLLVLFMSGVRDWLSLVLIGAVCTLLATIISIYFARRARSDAIGKVYNHEVDSQIQRYLNDHEIDLNGLVHTADQVLPPSAPIMRYLAVKNFISNQQEE